MTRFLLTIADLVILVLAVLRLCRALIADDIGKRYVLAPIYEWLIGAKNGRPKAVTSMRYGNQALMRTWWMFLLGGLTCPFCVGYWIGLGCVLLAWRVGPLGAEPTWWRILFGSLALNWIVGHVAVRVGDTDPDAPF